MSSDRVLERLAIFPLPGVALFPHALLPLHVFEPRYRELLRDCLSGSGMMAVAALDPGGHAGHGEPPSVRPICGLGQVIAHEELADGRSNIVLRGIGRVRIMEELPAEHSYRLVRAVSLDDETARHPEAPQHTLTLLAEQLAARLPAGGETLMSVVGSQRELGPLTDVLAAALVTDPGVRQALLETMDVVARAERVSAEIATVLTRFVEHNGPPN